jgi:carboxyl-terminal processing protease
VSLDFLDYEIDRTDGYLSENTSACILEYQKEHDLEVTGTVNAQTYKAVLSQVILSFSKLDERDYQLTKAMEVIHE